MSLFPHTTQPELDALRDEGKPQASGLRRLLPFLPKSMSTETEELFDVVIYHFETRKIDTIIGERMRRYDGKGSGRNTAELRQQTGIERVNNHYGVEIVPAGKFKKGDTLP